MIKRLNRDGRTDMEADLQTHVAFYLTGKKLTAHLDAVDGLNLRPALLTGYRDLTHLRYDFPLILVEGRPDGAFIEPLSGLIDGILDRIAKGDHGERIRKHVLRLEQEIRTLAASGASGLFSTLWDQAALPLIKADKQISESLSLARANLKIDGEVIDCNAALPCRLFGHAWANTQKQRARQFSKDIKRLVLKLSDIIKADFVNSDAGKSAENLRSSFGSGPMDSFDFEAMSRILTKSSAKKNLSVSRRIRVTNLLSTLQSQKFFPTSEADDGETYSFAFESCLSALAAYRERLPKVIELARAVAIAELEIKGEYSEAKHDPLFESFGENGLEARELGLFPDYLVRLNAGNLTGPEHSTLTEILSVDLPIKILVQTDDVIEESPLGNGHLAFALRSKQLASMAMGMSGVFVLQSPASNLYQVRRQIQRGLDYPGPALFSVFSGAATTTGELPAYLVGAAALESRVFPAFTFDPSAGRDWASRFSLDTNPQAELDWPLREFSYEDEKHQAVSLQTPFTLIDFVACDSRYSKHFARVPRARWNGTLSPVSETVARDERGPLDSVPCLLMVDPGNRLQKVIVDEKLIREARRCRSMWNSLQELGGINNSHADKLLAREKKLWEATAQPVSEATASVMMAVVATQSLVAPTEQEAEKSPDEAYIETSRCSTCNECTQINNKMFAYDGNMQAYIADVSAGTYAQLVEAAESCQVSIIHPGKPRNPNETGLEELLERAEIFL
ncbi:ferredoxin [Propionivibrio sp.]|uniref:ferredoxin n=1 Tax=Propionivibrio sp. TaxID=2212460 RepID=UPI003BF34F48